jgi:hypothetical protein
VDTKVTVASLAFCIAAFIGVTIPALIAAEVIPTRWYGMGHIGLTVAISLYVRRQICRYVAAREEIAFRLGQASQDLERGNLSAVRSLVD